VLAVAVLLCAAGAALPARADEKEAMNRVDFQVERSRDVANDWARAVVGITDEDQDPKELADRVNRAAAWGLDRARARQGIRVASGGYSTRPINDPKRGEIRIWRGSQELILETSDTALLSSLLGELQTRLQLQSISFTVSPERRRQVEAELIAEALAAFQARAESVSAQLGGTGYQLVHVSIQPSGGPEPIYRDARVMAAEALAPPSFEEGTSAISVHVHGTIELVR
jgi:predicted secreted protein